MITHKQVNFAGPNPVIPTSGMPGQIHIEILDGLELQVQQQGTAASGQRQQSLRQPVRVGQRLDLAGLVG
jgi:hypothetical protein